MAEAVQGCPKDLLSPRRGLPAGFVVETESARYLCEPKRASEMTDEVVQLKAKAATLWCQHASTVSEKPWRYVLIPHDAIEHSVTFGTLVHRFHYR
jgi:type III restriction enzyme